MVPSLASVWMDLNAIADALKLGRGCPGHLPTASQQSPASTPQSGASAAAHVPSPGWGGRGAIAESLRDHLQRAVDHDRKCAVAAAAAASGSAKEAVCRGVSVETLHASNMVRNLCYVFRDALVQESRFNHEHARTTPCSRNTLLITRRSRHTDTMGTITPSPTMI
jgi:hypothetical protein